ncbi:energy-coupling factor transporter transmembrane component T family protein [Psychrilyobacter atlanticus]|uniref:energy-coupling factor transporter transmembrane component T family protein n=1 Tax=Psychrilyobacter atlanticus TaxID=271091 RepID=UPI0004013B10|nr:energy-coupling factor transporter transmembrane component T [Psychrilyobacter atlanticus]
MTTTGTLYIDKKSPIHSLDGSIKLLMLLVWTAVAFLFTDIRVFLGLILGGAYIIRMANITFKEVKPLVIFLLIFTLFNSLFLILITPAYGSELIDQYTPIFNILGRPLTYETLWFAIMLSLKYLSILPITIIFIFTTHPSRFASSLNKIGVSYKIAYAVNIALRYIPDVRDEFVNIMHAQEARGVAFRKGEDSLINRFKNYNTILIPLVLSSLNRVEVVSNAMNLRGFGSEKTRSWYNGKKYGKFDFLAVALLLVGAVAGILINKFYLSGFWYPF